MKVKVQFSLQTSYIKRNPIVTVWNSEWKLYSPFKEYSPKKHPILKVSNSEWNLNPFMLITLIIKVKVKVKQPSLPPQQQWKGFYNRKSATRSRSAKSSYFNEKIPPALTLWCRRPTIMAALTPFAPYTNVDTTLCNRLPMRKWSSQIRSPDTDSYLVVLWWWIVHFSQKVFVGHTLTWELGNTPNRSLSTHI